MLLWGCSWAGRSTLTEERSITCASTCTGPTLGRHSEQLAFAQAQDEDQHVGRVEHVIVAAGVFEEPAVLVAEGQARGQARSARGLPPCAARALAIAPRWGRITATA